MHAGQRLGPTVSKTAAAAAAIPLRDTNFCDASCLAVTIRPLLEGRTAAEDAAGSTWTREESHV